MSDRHKSRTGFDEAFLERDPVSAGYTTNYCASCTEINLYENPIFICMKLMSSCYRQLQVIGHAVGVMSDAVPEYRQSSNTVRPLLVELLFRLFPHKSSIQGSVESFKRLQNFAPSDGLPSHCETQTVPHNQVRRNISPRFMLFLVSM